MKKSILLFALIGLLFSSCNKDKFDKIVMQIEGVVTDAKTGILVPEVTVKIMTNGGEIKATTNEQGYFNLGEITTGEYVVTASKDGFLTSSKEVYSTGIGYRLDGNTKEVQNIEIIVYPLTETISTTLYKKYDSQSALIAAANIPYTLYLGRFNEPVTGQTDESGLLLLENAPYGNGSYNNSVFLSIDFEENGIRFKDDITLYNLLNNNSRTIYGYSVEGDFGIVSTNLVDMKGHAVDDFDITGNIEFNFTQPVNVEGFDESVFYFNGYYGDLNVTWSNNNMKMVIDLSSSLTSGKEYSFSLGNLENESKTQTLSNYNYEFSTK